MTINPKHRLIVMIIVGLIAVSSPVWAPELFNAYLNLYNMTDRQKEGILILQEQTQKLEKSCFTKAL